MEEKKYPIYRFSATWNQSDYKNNGTSCRQMYKEKLSDEEMNEKLEEFKTNVTKDKEEVEFLASTVEYVEDETWVGKWFCHFTFNQFDNDDDARKSFQEFVMRKEVVEIIDPNTLAETIIIDATQERKTNLTELLVEKS